jgi:hypothetical protein
MILILIPTPHLHLQGAAKKKFRKKGGEGEVVN